MCNMSSICGRRTSTYDVSIIFVPCLYGQGYKFPDNDMGAPPVRFYLHTKKYHLETDILEQLIASSQVRRY